ncbi:hypothetical protein [Nostoc piscinale]|nr:hypothetical protein [Nostoc piscinale]
MNRLRRDRGETVLARINQGRAKPRLGAKNKMGAVYFKIQAT